MEFAGIYDCNISYFQINMLGIAAYEAVYTCLQSVKVCTYLQSVKSAHINLVVEKPMHFILMVSYIFRQNHSVEC